LGRRGAGAYPSGHQAENTLDRLQVHHRATQRQTTTHTLTLTPKDNLMEDGRMLEYPERTHTYTGRACKLHTERPQGGD